MVSRPAPARPCRLAGAAAALIAAGMLSIGASAGRAVVDDAAAGGAQDVAPRAAPDRPVESVSSPPAAPGAAPLTAPERPSPPRRVVSMNLCTDQLAMLLAAPGQLLSVSHLASDPQVSAMVSEAAAYPPNHGRAEEVYLLRPDLVLAGSFGGAPVAMLDRLGVRVVTLPPPQSLADVRAAITTVGAALGRQAAARAMLADFDARLARLRRPVTADAPLAATWGANGFSAGPDTLAGDVMSAAGLALLADRLGLAPAAGLPLESLVMADPDLIVTGSRYPGASRAEDLVDHPALRHLHARRVTIPDAEWTCAIPQVLDALDRLAASAGGRG